jgi:hypothetical protein
MPVPTRLRHRMVLWSIFLGAAFDAYFAHGDHPEMAGLLSALALVWMYEHRNLERKYERLRRSITAAAS